ncbi:hypothetical protein D1AOALGA4SA_3407 [Olavius algarvensis Delta 1 endosymbiont]|nr:hypothetical protein D1AOALGA4SA_3407 [Olavius algarvensis Delta 1 endosymbiont]
MRIFTFMRPLYRNYVAFNDTGFMPPTWNAGMLESWNNG